MKSGHVSVDEAVEYLNDLLKLDPLAVTTLFSNRISCNEELSNHPTVQCGEQDGAFDIGMLGILNGLFGVLESGDRKGWGYITLVFDIKGNAIKFERTKNCMVNLL